MRRGRSLRPNGELDRGSLHGSCPVISGVKWSVTKVVQRPAPSTLSLLPHPPGLPTSWILIHPRTLPHPYRAFHRLSCPQWYHVSAYGAGRKVEHKVYKLPGKPMRGDCSDPASQGCCRDADERCESWAEEGECAKNPGAAAQPLRSRGGAARPAETIQSSLASNQPPPLPTLASPPKLNAGFMVGSDASPGSCRLSCSACPPGLPVWRPPQGSLPPLPAAA